jgi:hypothetical protein
LEILVGQSSPAVEQDYWPGEFRDVDLYEVDSFRNQTPFCHHPTTNAKRALPQRECPATQIKRRAQPRQRVKFRILVILE